MRTHRFVWFLTVLGLATAACREARPPLAFSPSALPAAQTDHGYEVTLTVSGNQTPVGQMYVAEGQLPPGLTLTHQRGASTATLSGTPRGGGRFSFTIGAWCLGTSVSGQTGRQAYTLDIQ